MFEVKKPVILFDEAKHLYTDPADKAVIPSTTQIAGLLEISGDYSKVPNIEFYADRGTLAHYALEMFDATGDKVTAVEMAKDKATGMNATWEDAEPYFESGLKWLATHPMTEIETEKRFLGNVNGMRYAGTIDISSKTLDGLKGVVDWKTSKDCNKEAYFLQIGAYAEAVNADFGVVVRLRDDGELADMIQVDCEKYRKMFVELLTIFYSENLDDAQKRAEAKKLVFGTVQINKDKAELLAVKNDEKKKIEKEISELKTEITESLAGASGNYEDDNIRVSLSFVPGSVKKVVNIEMFITELAEVLDADVLKRIVDSTTEEKKTAGSYRLTTKIIEKKEPKKKTVKKKPEPAAEVKPDAEPEPAKEKAQPKDSTPINFGTQSELEPQIKKILNDKGITDDLEEIFWIDKEGIFGLSRTASEFDMEAVLEIAQETTKEYVVKLQKEYNKGKV